MRYSRAMSTRARALTLVGALAVLTGGAGGVAGAAGTAGRTPVHSATAATAPRRAQAVSVGTSCTTAPAPCVPRGVYLGAWVLPDQSDHTNQSQNQLELSELGDFEDAIGRNLAVVHVYQPWSSPPSNPDPLAALASDSTLSALSADGAIPMIDWGCGDTPGNTVTDTQIADGDEDAFITSYAEQLKAYGRPVFLRWFWEPNLIGTEAQINCMGQPKGTTTPATGAYAAEYVKAFQHIYDIFKGPGGVGATNVAFVWSPGLGGSRNPKVLAGLYPGSSYVDWIGIDGYSRPAPQSPPNPSFATLFSTVYQELQGSFYGTSPKPVLIAETGAVSTNQMAYLSSVQTALDPGHKGSFGNVHGFVYYDSTNTNLGSSGQWALTPSAGLPAFAQLAQDPTFTTPGT